MTKPRHISWFSCGAASAIAAKMALNKWPDTQVVYCDTSASEHPDNVRFMKDIESWLKVDVIRLKSDRYNSIDDVFKSARYMSGIAGARCTIEMKKYWRYVLCAFLGHVRPDNDMKTYPDGWHCLRCKDWVNERRGY